VELAKWIVKELLGIAAVALAVTLVLALANPLVAVPLSAVLALGGCCLMEWAG
jgi:hypothetical protein